MPLNYPVCPASAVSYPSSEDVEALLISDLDSEHPLFIGSLLARDAVKIRIDADNLVSRHVSIFGMSGSGKTVMVRRIMDELLRKKYPMLVLDIHGDYLGFIQKQKKLSHSCHSKIQRNKRGLYHSWKNFKRRLNWEIFQKRRMGDW